MKIPAVWLAAAFATGVLLRPREPFERRTVAHRRRSLILSGAAAAKFLRTLWPAAAFAMAAWCVLGAASVSIEQLAVPRDNVNRSDRLRKNRHEPASALARPPARRSPAPPVGRALHDRYRKRGNPQAARFPPPAACAPIISGREMSRNLCRHCALAIASKHSSAPDRRAISWIPARRTLARFFARDGVDVIGSLRSLELLTETR